MKASTGRTYSVHNILQNRVYLLFKCVAQVSKDFTLCGSKKTSRAGGKGEREGGATRQLLRFLLIYERTKYRYKIIFLNNLFCLVLIHINTNSYSSLRKSLHELQTSDTQKTYSNVGQDSSLTLALDKHLLIYNNKKRTHITVKVALIFLL